MRKRTINPTGLMIHCSDSNFGDVNLIRKWHTDPIAQNGRGWLDIGYNWVICNGMLTPRSKYDPELDGMIQEGRNAIYEGAHAKGYNVDYLSICLVGKNHFSFKQITHLFELIKQMAIANLIEKFIVGKPLTDKQIVGHHEVDSNKTCPNIDMDDLRKYLNLYLKWGEAEIAGNV